MRTIIWFIYFWAYLIAFIPKCNQAKKHKAAGEKESCDALVEDTIRRWATSLLKLAGAKITVIGKENLPGTPAVYIANHQGNFDIPILLTSLDKPHALISKMELGRLPFIKDWAALLECVFIDRSNARQSMTALGDAADNLASNGRSIIIFPEGTRSRNGDVGEFKGGAFRVATKANAIIVPIVIDGSYKLMEQNKMWIKPASVTVKILPPIETAGKTREEMKTLPEEVRQMIAKAKAEN